MRALEEFEIPFKALSEGIHQFEFRVEDRFFRHFENPVVTEGDFQVILILEKKVNVSTLHFSFTGMMRDLCDRCLEKISLPVKGQIEIFIKTGTPENPGEENIMYISPNQGSINVAEPILEMISLQRPISFVVELIDENANHRCNSDMVKYIEAQEKEKEENPAWEVLKGLNFN